jgi:hypothetical protein
MHTIKDKEQAEKVFDNVDKLKNVSYVYFVSVGGDGKRERWAIINHDYDGNIIISHKDIEVKVNPDTKKVLGYDKTGKMDFSNRRGRYPKYLPKYLDDQAIGTILDICANGTPEDSVILK